MALNLVPADNADCFANKSRVEIDPVVVGSINIKCTPSFVFKCTRRFYHNTVRVIDSVRACCTEIK